jgi:hypothetical protein
LSIVCFLARFLNHLGHSRQESRVFGCEKQETSSASQRPSCRRVSRRLTFVYTCKLYKLGCPAWQCVTSERLKRMLMYVAETRLVCPLVPGACFTKRHVLPWQMKILVRMALVIGISFTERQVTRYYTTTTKRQSNLSRLTSVCFTKTFSCHTHLSLYSLFWPRQQVH